MLAASTLLVGVLTWTSNGPAGAASRQGSAQVGTRTVAGELHRASPDSPTSTSTAIASTSTAAGSPNALVPSSPTIASLSPSGGPTTGGTAFTISGTNFTTATAVDFGSTAAASFTVQSPTTITATSPAHAAGVVAVSVTTPVGTSSTTTPTCDYDFGTAPAISTIAPPAGPVGGGTAVTIAGTGFTGATSVDFGAVPATAFSVRSTTEIVATSPPAGATRLVSVTVGSPFGTSTTREKFT